MKGLAEQYIEAGLVITPIPNGTKGPTTNGWQRRENCIERIDQINGHTAGWGLCHAYSGTMALDVDQGDKAITWLAKRDVDLVALFKAPDAVRINSGNPGHGKLIYRLPEGMPPMWTKKVKDEEKHDIIDFRCGTRAGLTVQDCLPGTIHPDTGLVYTWQGDWRNIPEIPEALLPIWREVIQGKQRKTEPPPTSTVSPGAKVYGSGLRNKVRSMLECVNPELGHEQWVEILMALHSLDEEWALGMAHAWSAGKAQGRPVEMYSEAEVETKWRSFTVDPTGITIATLRRIAKDNGWVEYTPMAMFGELPEATSTKMLGKVGVIPKFAYIYDVHKFLDTANGIMNSPEKMNTLNPMGRGATWCGRFFRDLVDKGVNWFEGITYRPGVATGAYECDHFNIWKPPSVMPATGDISLWSDLMNHLFPDELIRHHITQWMAYTLQNQHIKINHALLIIGDQQGAGKDSAFEPLLHGIGSENHTMVFPAELHGTFNDFLKGKKLLVVQEIMDYSKGELENYLKPLLASPPTEIGISEKFVGRYKLPNIWNTLMFSNELNAAKISNSDRRYFVARVTAEAFPRIKKLWKWYDRDGQKGGLNRVLNHLLTLDVSDFEPYDPPPMTAAKEEAQELSLSMAEIEIQEFLNAHPYMVEFSIRQLQTRIGNGKLTSQGIGLALRKLKYIKLRKENIWVWYKPKWTNL